MDYPRTLQALVTRFSTEASCLDYLCELRWPDGICCTRCGNLEGWWTRRQRWTCAACDHPQSVTAGTIFHRSHVSLQLWFQVIWWVVSQKSGVSALGLQRVLGLGSYRTAWTLLHQLRQVMVRPGREVLRGHVEVDETFVGGYKPGHTGRSAGGKALVVIAAERRGKRTGRIRMQQIPDASEEALRHFVRAHLHPTCICWTDGWRGYDWLAHGGYRHRRVTGVALGEQIVLPHVHRVAALLKRWLLGTHHGRTARSYLNAYLNEYVFRFNRRTSRSRGLLFYRVLQNAVVAKPYSYQELRETYAGTPQHMVELA